MQNRFISTALLVFGLFLSSFTFAKESMISIARAGRICNLLLSNFAEPNKGNYQSIRVWDGFVIGRMTKFQVPEGTPPPGGWPAALVFQGSFSPVRFWRKDGSPMGLEFESDLVQQLLKSGFAVIAPNAMLGLGWQTNLLPAGAPFGLTSDYILVESILNEIEKGTFGEINSNELFAAGVSSGGYNSSRMTLEFPGRFKAIAIQAGSYATCLGDKCRIPSLLPKSHAPTLFIAGRKDELVPLTSVKAYYVTLKTSGVEVKMHVEKNGAHGWYKCSPQLILNWFKGHLGDGAKAAEPPASQP